MERVDYESIIIHDLIGYYERKEVDITPWYQRRSVWSQPQKSYLINTILENKPVPSIYIRYSVDLATEKSIKEIVDGQQRIRCVIEYKNSKFPAKHPNHTKFVYFKELSKAERIRFLQSALSVGYLIGASDADVIEIFARINSVSKTLNPQEKRNALYSGAFKQFCLKEAIDRLPFWRENRIFTDTQIARMLEVQFISDLVMNFCEGLQDFSSKRLSRYYGEFDVEFPSSTEIKRRLDRVYRLILGLSDGILAGSIFSVPQLLFSLFIVIDSVKKVSSLQIEDCIVDVDARVESISSGDSLTALSSDEYRAFTSGNLHRIRSRKLRDSSIKSYFQ